jgi:hypothetical protein
MSNRRLRSTPDLVERLAEQMGFIERSAKLYDEGAEQEAKRLATSIRVLVHETPASHSLLGQLGVLNVVEFCDSAIPIDPRNVATTLGLLGFGFAPSGISFIPLLGSAWNTRQVPFAVWWERTVTHVPGRSLNLSRRDYVLGLANREGGAHVDPVLDPFYAALRYDNALGFGQGPGGPEPEGRPLNNDPAMAAVRQIAYELVRTIESAPTLREALTPSPTSDDE